MSDEKKIDHPDDEPMIFGYSSGLNITFKGEGESGVTWGEWRAMDQDRRDNLVDQFVWNELDIDVFPKDKSDYEDEE